MNYIVTGTDTNVGKTVVSCLLSMRYQLPYWKPIQTGSRENSDSETLRKWSQSSLKIYNEVYSFQFPSAPNLASRLENSTINLNTIIKMCPKEDLIIEGAGGLYVPINKKYLMIDLIKKLYDLKKTKVILVTSSRLGTINHTLLSLKALDESGIKNKGIILVQSKNSKESFESSLMCQSAIDDFQRFASTPVIATLPYLSSINYQQLDKVAATNALWKQFKK